MAPLAYLFLFVRDTKSFQFITKMCLRERCKSLFSLKAVIQVIPTAVTEASLSQFGVMRKTNENFLNLND